MILSMRACKDGSSNNHKHSKWITLQTYILFTSWKIMATSLTSSLFISQTLLFAPKKQAVVQDKKCLYPASAYNRQKMGGMTSCSKLAQFHPRITKPGNFLLLVIHFTCHKTWHREFFIPNFPGSFVIPGIKN